MKIAIQMVFSVVLVVLLAACVTERVGIGADGEAFMERQVQKIVARIPYQSGPALIEDLNRLIAFGHFSVKPMCECLKSRNAKVRSSAAFVLGQLKVTESLDELFDLTDDKNKLVRLEAARAILDIGAWDTVPILLVGLGDNEKSVRYLSFDALNRKTGENFGFQFDGPAEERREATEKWFLWWEIEKENPAIVGNMISSS